MSFGYCYAKHLVCFQQMRLNVAMAMTVEVVYYTVLMMTPS